MCSFQLRLVVWMNTLAHHDLVTALDVGLGSCIPEVPFKFALVHV